MSMGTMKKLGSVRGTRADLAGMHRVGAKKERCVLNGQKQSRAGSLPQGLDVDTITGFDTISLWERACSR
ncbi:hypothetical protein PMm318_A04820 [Pseudomonas moorei]